MAEDFIQDIIEKSILEIISEELEHSESKEKIESILNSDNIKNANMIFFDQMSSDSVETIENIMYEKVFEENTYADEFIARQNQKWGKAFVASKMMYICILESAEHYCKYVNDVYANEISFMYHALRNIHGRALQVYLEILCLNQNGFADGAYARWRSLYELSIVSAFIKKYGESVAKSFVESANTSDRYEWARIAKCFKNYSKNKYITFSAIQNNVELATEEWKKEYDFVNKLVHASPQGTMYRLGGNTSVAIPVGRTDWGMSISAIHSAISLSQITSDFFTVFPHGDSTIAMMTFHKWVNKVSDYYKAIEETCAPCKEECEIDNR